MAELSDAILVERCRAGDTAAFSLLVTRHIARVRRLLLAVVGNPAEVDDLLQETFLRAYLNLALAARCIPFSRLGMRHRYQPGADLRLNLPLFVAEEVMDKAAIWTDDQDEYRPQHPADIPAGAKVTWESIVR